MHDALISISLTEEGVSSCRFLHLRVRLPALHARFLHSPVRLCLRFSLSARVRVRPSVCPIERTSAIHVRAVRAYRRSSLSTRRQGFTWLVDKLAGAAAAVKNSTHSKTT